MCIHLPPDRRLLEETTATANHSAAAATSPPTSRTTLIREDANAHYERAGNVGRMALAGFMALLECCIRPFWE